MKRALNPREKRLLIGCLLTIFLVINFLAYGQFSSRRTALTSSISRLKDQSANNKVWLSEQDLWQKRGKWLQTNMPSTDSVGRSQGQLLDELQNSALDSGLKVSNQTPLQSTPVTMPNSEVVATEVAVSLRVKGDQDKVLRWLLSIQSPERFLAMKTFEIELDTKSKEKIPQAQCNLTLARWFNPNAAPAPAPAAPDAAAAPAPVPASVPADDNPDNTNPAPAPAPASTPAPAPSAPAEPKMATPSKSA